MMNPNETNYGPPKLYVAEGYSLEDRVRLIFAMTTWSVLEPVTVRAASEMARACPDENDEDCIIATVFDTHRQLIRYGWEHDGMDLFRSWKWSVVDGRGDCDCMVIANNAILACLGFPVGVSVVKQQGPQDHIWSIVWKPRNSMPTGQAIVPLDLSAPGSWPGWEEPSSAYTHRRNYRYDLERWVAWCRAQYGGSRPDNVVEDILASAPRVSPM